MDGWNTTFLLGLGLFSRAMLVSGRVTLDIQSYIPPKVWAGVFFRYILGVQIPYRSSGLVALDGFWVN